MRRDHLPPRREFSGPRSAELDAAPRSRGRQGSVPHCDGFASAQGGEAKGAACALLGRLEDENRVRGQVSVRDDSAAQFVARFRGGMSSVASRTAG